MLTRQILDNFRSLLALHLKWKMAMPPAEVLGSTHQMMNFLDEHGADLLACCEDGLSYRELVDKLAKDIKAQQRSINSFSYTIGKGEDAKATVGERADVPTIGLPVFPLRQDGDISVSGDFKLPTPPVDIDSVLVVPSKKTWYYTGANNWPESYVWELGFESWKELNHLVASVDLTIPGNREVFQRWADSDGTKAGLIALHIFREGIKFCPEGHLLEQVDNDVLGNITWYCKVCNAYYRLDSNDDLKFYPIPPDSRKDITAVSSMEFNNHLAARFAVEQRFYDGRPTKFLGGDERHNEAVLFAASLESDGSCYYVVYDQQEKRDVYTSDRPY